MHFRKYKNATDLAFGECNGSYHHFINTYLVWVQHGLGLHSFRDPLNEGGWRGLFKVT